MCPHCGRVAIIPLNSLRNIETFQKQAITITECCGKLVWITPRFSYAVSEYQGTQTEDDWGRKSK
jgi:hypothetical protein